MTKLARGATAAPTCGRLTTHKRRRERKPASLTHSVEQTTWGERTAVAKGLHLLRGQISSQVN